MPKDVVSLQNVFALLGVEGLRLALGAAHGLRRQAPAVLPVKAQQIVFGRNKKNALSRIALTPGASGELIVHAAGSLALRAENQQAAQRAHPFRRGRLPAAKADIGAAPGHICGDDH